MALMDTAFRYVRVNEALARMNGLPADEHFGRTLRDVLGDELASEIEPLHRQVLETGAPILDQHMHRELPGSTGETRDSLVSYYPVRTMSDEPIGVGVVITDVTERERARAAAEAVGARLSVLAEASERLASTLDYETTLAELASLLVPEFADWYAVDVLDDARHLARRAAVAVDNARLYREAAERARAALVVEHVADGVVLVERDGIIRLWNPAIEHITGLPAVETLGRRADEVFGSWTQI